MRDFAVILTVAGISQQALMISAPTKLDALNIVNDEWYKLEQFDRVEVFELTGKG